MCPICGCLQRLEIPVDIANCESTDEDVVNCDTHTGEAEAFASLLDPLLIAAEAVYQATINVISSSVPRAVLVAFRLA
jgi:hypothetical protein